MAEFDPDQYLKQKTQLASNAGFDPDQYLKQKNSLVSNTSSNASDMGALDAAKIQGESGVALGLRPVVAGLGAAAGDLMGQPGSLLDTRWDSLRNAFSEARQNAIDEQNKASEQYPKISTAANIGGSLLSAPLLPAKGLAGAIKLGTALGAANAAGTAQSLPEAAQDIGGGALGGGVTHGLVGAIGEPISNGLASLAENKAFKASGAMLKDFRAAYSKDPDKINELGRTMLDNGLVGVGDDVSSIAKKSELLRQQTGQKIGDVYNKVLDSITSPKMASQITPEMQLQIQASGFHPEAQADELKSIIAQKLKGVPGSTNAIKKSNDIISELALNGNDITPQHALELKGHVDSMINWSKKSSELPIDQDALKEIRTFIQNKLNNQVSTMDQILQTPQTKELANLNRLYGNVATITNISKDRALREAANRSFGLTDTIAASGGLGAGALASGLMGHGPGLGALAAGAGLGVGNKLARTYGNSALASGANSMAQGLQNNSVVMPAVNKTIWELMKNQQQGQQGGQ